MTLPVEFDDYFGFMIEEIGDEWADWSLSSKFVTREPTASKLRPKPAFRERRILSKLSGAVNVLGLRGIVPTSHRALPAGLRVGSKSYLFARPEKVAEGREKDIAIGGNLESVGIWNRVFDPVFALRGRFGL